MSYIKSVLAQLGSWLLGLYINCRALAGISNIILSRKICVSIFNFSLFYLCPGANK